ncbi:uncharacterized protein [Ranitomeya imitator]
MDTKARELNWLSCMDAVFNGDATQNVSSENGSKLDLKNSMKYLLKKRTRTWWNKASLERYLAKGLIPRGLRVKIMPSFVIEDTLFRTKWEEACNNCSRALIELLIGNNKKSLDKFDVEIESTRIKLSESLTTAEMEALNKDIDNQFQIWEKEVKDTKTKKFQRDLQDLRSGTIYRWQVAPTGSRDIVRSSSFSSLSSREEDSDVRIDNRLYNLRRNTNSRRGHNYKRKEKRRDEASTSRLQH